VCVCVCERERERERERAPAASAYGVQIPGFALGNSAAPTRPERERERERALLGTIHNGGGLGPDKTFREISALVYSSTFTI